VSAITGPNAGRTAMVFGYDEVLERRDGQFYTTRQLNYLLDAYENLGGISLFFVLPEHEVAGETVAKLERMFDNLQGGSCATLQAQYCAPQADGQSPQPTVKVVDEPGLNALYDVWFLHREYCTYLEAQGTPVIPYLFGTLLQVDSTAKTTDGSDDLGRIFDDTLRARPTTEFTRIILAGPDGAWVYDRTSGGTFGMYDR
jgi:hypothetical protein